MDVFSVCLDSFCLAAQGVLHLGFLCRLTGRTPEPRHFAAYLLPLFLLQWLSGRIALPGAPAIGLQTLILYSVSRFALRNRGTSSCIAAILAVYISQLAFGLVNSVEAAVFPHLLGRPLLYPLLVLATLFAFGICSCCYAGILKFLSFTEDRQTPYFQLLLFPVLFFFAMELYILQMSYHVLSASVSLADAGKHAVLLFLQALGLGALLCTLYAYQRTCLSFQAQAALSSLTQAARAQREYVAGAQARYEQTK